MNGGSETPSRAGSGEDVDPGEPIEALASLRHETSTGFLAGVRNRILFRRTASHLVDLLWSGPALVFMEFLQMIFELFPRPESDRNEPD